MRPVAYAPSPAAASAQRAAEAAQPAAATSAPFLDTLAANVARGAEQAAGQILMQKAVAKLVPALLSLTTTTQATTAAMAQLTSAAALCSATMHRLSAAAVVSAPSTTAAGGAAAVASRGFFAMAASVAAVLLPFAAIAAVAYGAYKIIFDWKSIPLWFKLINPPLVALKMAIEALILPFRMAYGAARLFVSAITLPFRVASASVGLLYSGLMLIPRALLALPGLAWRAATAISSAAIAAAKWAGSVVIATPGALFRGTKTALTTLGEWGKAAGNAMQSLGNRIVEPLRKAASEFAKYGSELADLAREHEVSAQTAAVLAHAAAMTGASISDVAESLKEGTPEFARWRAEAEATGLVLSEDAVSAAQRYTEAQQRTTAAIKGFWANVGAAVAPALTDAAETMAGAVRGATAWVREHQAAIATAFRWASALATAGTVVATLATGVGTLGAFLGPVVTGLAAAAAAVTLWQTGAAGGFWRAYGDQIRGAYETVRAYGARFVAFASETSSGMFDAIKAGRLDLAVQIAWSGAKVAWSVGLAELNALTGDGFASVLSNLAAGNWSTAGQAAMVQVKLAFQQGLNYLDGLWLDVRNAADSAFRWIVDSADSAWVSLQNAIDPTWLWLQDMFPELKRIAQDAWGELAAAAEGAGAAIANVGGKLKTLLTAASFLAPSLSGPIATAIGSLSTLGAAATDEVQKAIDNRRLLNAAAAAGLKPPTQEQREAQLAARRDVREQGLAGRTETRREAGVAREAERDAEYADRYFERLKEIIALRAQAAELAAQGDADAAAASEKRAADLQRQLSEAKAAREEADRQRGDVEGLKTQIDAAGKSDKKTGSSPTFGTFGTYGAALAMGFSNGTAERQLAVQQEQLREAQQLRNLIGSRRLVMAP